MSEKYLTTEEVANKLNCSKSYLYQAETKARLGAVRFGKRSLRWPESQIDNYLISNTVIETDTWHKVFEAAEKRKMMESRFGLW